MAIDISETLVAAGVAGYAAMSTAIVALWRHAIVERRECREQLAALWDQIAKLNERAMRNSGQHRKVP